MYNKFAERIICSKESDVSELLKIADRPEFISFGGGFPAPELFPLEEIKKIALTVLDEQGYQALQYSSTEGYSPLREIIARKMNSLGIKASMENIIITSGSQQGLDLAGKVFIDKDDIIICESPTYLAAICAFQSFYPKFIDIPMDENGMILEDLVRALEKNHKKIKFIYSNSSFQNPSGRSLSLERRRKLIEIAREYEVVILEDNPYGDIGFEGDMLPPIKSFDSDGRVVYMGSFSKIVCPGLRVGWICADSYIIDKFAFVKQGTDLHTSPFSQMVVAKFMETVNVDAHVAKITAAYQKRRDVMIETIQREFPVGIKHTYPKGGMFIWVELPSHISARDLLVMCMENHVAFVPGGAFFPNGGNENTFRLNYSNMPEQKILEGITKMGKALKHMINPQE